MCIFVACLETTLCIAVQYAMSAGYSLPLCVCVFVPFLRDWIAVGDVSVFTTSLDLMYV